jgi:hypothetical protein
MTISFFEPGDVPQPPDKTKIEYLNAIPSPDGWRVKIELHVTPFLQRPNVELVLLRLVDSGDPFPVADLSIVETMHPRMEFTIHVRRVDDPVGEYSLKAMLYYREQLEQDATEPPPIQIKDKQAFSFRIPPHEASNL